MTISPARRSAFEILRRVETESAYASVLLASLDDRTTWLERAQRGGWSVDRLATTARGANASPPAPHVAYKASVEAVAKKVSSLNEADDRLLAKAVRAGLADAVEELATQVERLTARLHKAQRRSMSIAR